MQFSDRFSVMRQAFQLATQGQGFVEPNPMVGAVLVDDQLNLLGEGCHQKFGGPHAEVEAIRHADELGNKERLTSATLFVSLEPCSHSGADKKQPPCTLAFLAAGIRKVVIGRLDPNPSVNGNGVEVLRSAGIEVEVGMLEAEAKRLTSPFAKRQLTGMPWVIGKWAMSWDGKIATGSGDSKWISNEASRAVAHQIRGRVDAILIGSETARRDDPQLTARPTGPRTAARVVFDSIASLRTDSQLVTTLSEAPLLVLAGPDTPAENVARLHAAGVEVCVLGLSEGESLAAGSSKDVKRIRPVDPQMALKELGRRGMTNVLVEGGGSILGAFADMGLIDEVHTFIGPRLIGGQAAPSPLRGVGSESIAAAPVIDHLCVEILGDDVHLHGIVQGHCW